VSSGGGGPLDCSGRLACDGATAGAGVGVSRCHGHLKVRTFGGATLGFDGATVGAGVGELRCHGHWMADVLLKSRTEMDAVAKATFATGNLFIGED
jgi:hypothetical protein